MSEQEKSLRDCFAKFDANGDGKIQESEFKRLMSSLGGFSSKEIKRLFKEADTDGSVSVDWREFLSWIINGTRRMKRALWNQLKWVTTSPST